MPSPQQEGTVAAWDKAIKEYQMTPIEGTVLAVLHVAARYGLPTLAAEALKQLDVMGAEKKEQHFAALLEACVSAGLLKVALETLSFIRQTGTKPNKHTSAAIFEMLKSDIDKTDDAFNLLYDLKEEGKKVDIEAMNVVIRAAIAQGDLNRAVGIYKAAPDWGVKPLASTFNILFRGCLEHNQLELAPRIISEMEELKVKADGETYEALIRLALVPDDYEDAFFYIQQMQTRGFVPSVYVYEDLIRKLVRNNDDRSATAIQEMQDHGYEVAPDLQEFIDSRGVNPFLEPPPPPRGSLLDS